MLRTWVMVLNDNGFRGTVLLKRGKYTVKSYDKSTHTGLDHANAGQL